ncbi:MAG: N-6 DNA methylase [Gammaproteobacteria bacterium]|nr:N-6 DNA methylase [Gammaproteobacteria bacterium]
MLGALPHDEATGDAIRVVAECANRVADSLSELGYDHAGPLYHRILGSAKSDGAFYTNNLSAIMLARLSLANDLIDWSDSGAVGKLRIIDPACGTGTLLMASLQTIKALVAGRGNGEMGEGERNALHKRIVEDVLCGLDINQHGVQLAACNMTLGAPTVDYERMNLVTMPHGPQGDGSPKAGSLEILTAADDVTDLSTVTHGAPQRSLETLDGEQVSESEEIRFPLHDLDGVIMNAPFTDNRKRGRKFSRAALTEMQRHEIEIRNRLEERDPDAAAVITTNSIRSFFTPLAERLLRSDRAFLAKVLPVTACTGASGVAERRFLAERFHIERIVTTHDPKRIAFSENTSIHESLLICRRRSKEDRPPTEFVSLRKMPSNAEEAIEVADAISAGRVGDWGSVCRWPADRMRGGDWTPVQWFDGALAEAVFGLEGHADLVTTGSVLTPGATGRTAQDSWRRMREGADPQMVRKVFDSVSAEIRRTMLDAPEQSVVPGGRRAHLHERVLRTSGHLMLATRYNTVSGRLTALWSETRTFGFGWIPSTGPSRGYEKAVCAWWNSTPGRMLLLNRRAKTLTYLKWSKEHLKSVPCPEPDTPGSNALAKAWEQVKHVPLFRLAQAEGCAARQVIDAAAAITLGVSGDEIAEWRKRLAAEPTITNARAPQLGEDRQG